VPTYDYHCEANGETVRVFHSIHGRIRTWGKLCEQAGKEPGGIAPETPVQRLVGGGMLRLNAGSGGHGAGSCCGVDGCG